MQQSPVPTEALPPAMLRDVLRAAMSDVTQAERRIDRAHWNGVDNPPKAALIRRHEVIAFYVLLCFEWGQSPDVVKVLSFDAARPTSVQDWRQGSLPVTVRWVKNRGGRRDIAVLPADKEWRAGALLRRLHKATAPIRQTLEGEWRHYPWVYAAAVPTSSGPSTQWRRHKRYQRNAPMQHCLQYEDGTEMWLDSAFSETPRYSFKTWCEEVKLIQDQRVLADGWPFGLVTAYCLDPQADIGQEIEVICPTWVDTALVNGWNDLLGEGERAAPGDLTTSISTNEPSEHRAQVITYVDQLPDDLEGERFPR